MKPTPISKYTLWNNGSGTIIYPQLRSVSEASGYESILWDGRKALDWRYSMAINTSCSVDLEQAGVPVGSVFFLSANVVAGYDKYCGPPEGFIFDPSSSAEATAIFTGTTLGGFMTYSGIKSDDEQDDTLNFDADTPWELEEGTIVVQGHEFKEESTGKGNSAESGVWQLLEHHSVWS